VDSGGLNVLAYAKDSQLWCDEKSFLQVYSSFKLSSITHSTRLTYFRLILTVVCSISFIIMLPTGILARMQFDGKKRSIKQLLTLLKKYFFQGSDPTKWYPSNKGWGLHLCSTISEWLMALGFNVYILTFAIEFKKVTLDSPRVREKVVIYLQ